MKFASRAVVHSLVRQHRLKMSRCVAAICKSPGGDVVPASCKGVRKGGGLGLTPPLELDNLQSFITCAKEINCFRTLFAC